MSNRLYVGNLPYNIVDADLINFFTSAGMVEKVSIVTDRITGKQRGFGFVDFVTEVDAKKAIELFNGKQMLGRSLVINEAREKEEKPNEEKTNTISSERHNLKLSNKNEDFNDYEQADKKNGKRKRKNDWRMERRHKNRRNDFSDEYY